jgi:hypothetical protein
VLRERCTGAIRLKTGATRRNLNRMRVLKMPICLRMARFLHKAYGLLQMLAATYRANNFKS